MAYRASGSGRNFDYKSEVPRGAASAYALYLQDHYRRLRKHFYPRIRDQRVIMQYCSQTWKQETDVIKARYADYAKFDKQRAIRDRLVWLQKVKDGLVPFVPQRRHKPRPQGFPRVTRNAFMYYAAEVRPQLRLENPNILACDMMKLISTKWKLLDDQGKKRFKDLSAADKSRYKNQKQQYRDDERRRRRLKTQAKRCQRLNRFNQRVPQAFLDVPRRPPNPPRLLGYDDYF